MPALGSPSLDQLRVFLAVVDAGSFSAAARRLNRRQSVVSYTIANLERHLGGLMLFDRRQPQAHADRGGEDPAVRSPQGGAWHRRAARQGHGSSGRARTRTRGRHRRHAADRAARLDAGGVPNRLSDRQPEPLRRSLGRRRPARARPDLRDRRQCGRGAVDGRPRPEASRQHQDAFGRSAEPSFGGLAAARCRSPRPEPISSSC